METLVHPTTVVTPPTTTPVTEAPTPLTSLPTYTEPTSPVVEPPTPVVAQPAEVPVAAPPVPEPVAATPIPVAPAQTESLEQPVVLPMQAAAPMPSVNPIPQQFGQTPSETPQPPRKRSFSLPGSTRLIAVFGLFMVLLVGATLLFRKGQSAAPTTSSSSVVVPEQDLSAGTILNDGAANQPEARTLIVNGDVRLQGSLDFASGNYIGSFTQGTLTGNQTYTLPDASGTLCLSSNNCGYVTATSLTQLQTDVSGLQAQSGNGQHLSAGNGVEIVGETIQNTGVLSLNGQSGSIVLTGGSGVLVSGSVIQNTGVLTVNGQTGSVSFTGGSGVNISGTTISNSGVLSLGGQSGDLSLVSGPGISVSGLTISNNGVTSVQGLAGNVVFTAGSGIDITGTAVSNTGVTLLTGTANQVSVSGGTGSVTLSLPQDIAVTSSPSFSGLTATTLTATNLTSSAGLTVGATNKALTLQGSTTQLTATNAGNTATLTFVNPTSNVVYRFTTAAAGTYDVCTTTGNCTGVGGGVSTPGGTAGTIPKFTSSQGIGDSLITDNGTKVTINGNFDVTGVINGQLVSSDAHFTGNVTVDLNLGVTGTLNVNTITPTAAMTIGTSGQDLLLQGSAVTIKSTAGGITNSLVFATPSGSNKTITIPNVSGTICLTSGNCAGVGGTGDVLQNGNSFSTAMTIGTNDNFALNFETNGSTRMTVDANGRVGINTSGSSFLFDVNGTARIAGNLQLDTQLRDNQGNSIIQQSAVGVLSNRTLTIGNGTYSDTLLSGGNVGIGTSTSAAKLQVNGNIRLGNSAAATDEDGGFSISNGGQLTIQANDGTTSNGAFTDLILKAGTSGSLASQIRLYTQGTEVFTVSATGNIGIGDASPTTARLRVAAGNVQLDNTYGFQIRNNAATAISIAKLDSSNNLTFGATAGMADTTVNAGTGNLLFATSSGTAVTILNGGNVGIGVTPTVPLHVNKNSDTDYVARFFNTSASATNPQGILVRTTNAATNVASIHSRFTSGANDIWTLLHNGAVTQVLNSASATGLTIKAAASQSANLQEWQDSTGAVLTRITNTGGIVTPGARISQGATGGFTNTGTSIETLATSWVGLAVRGLVSQTANLQEWQSSTGAVQASVGPTGAISSGSSTNSGNFILKLSDTSSMSGFLSYVNDGVTKWQLYQNDHDSRLYLRDSANARMQVTYTPGTAGNAVTQFSDKLVVQAGSGQSANLQEWQDSAGSVLAKITSAGNLLIDPNGTVGVQVQGVNAPQLFVGGQSSASSVTATIKAIASQTGDLLQFKNSANTILTAIQSDGKLVFGPSGSQDTNLYRSAADTLKTDDDLIVAGSGGIDITASDLTVTRATGTSNAIRTFVGAEGVARFVTDASGALYWGSGSASQDTTLYRAGVGRLHTNTDFEAGGAIDATGQISSSSTIIANNGGTAQIKLQSNGGVPTIFFSNSNDTSLSRASAGVLQTPGALTVGGTLTVGTATFTSATTNEIKIRADSTDVFQYDPSTGKTTSRSYNARSFLELGYGTTDGIAKFGSTNGTSITLLVKGVLSQSANLQEWQNSAGSVLAKIDSTGQVYTPYLNNQAGDGYFVLNNGGNFGTGSSVKLAIGASGVNGAKVDIYNQTASDVGLVVRGATSQSADFFQVKTSGGSVIARVNANGVFEVPNNGLTNGGTLLANQLGVGTTLPSGSQYMLINQTSGGAVALTIKASASPSADLIQFQNSSGTVLSRIYSDGSLNTTTVEATTKVLAGGTTQTSGFPLAVLGSTFLEASSASNKPLIVRGAASQTADLQQWQASGGTVLSKIDKDGGLYFTPTANANIILQGKNASSAWATFQVDGSGNVEIGAASNLARVFRISPTAASNYVEFSYSSGTTGGVLFRPSAYDNTARAFDVAAAADASKYLTVQGDGRTWIGLHPTTSTVTPQLHVSPNTSSTIGQIIQGAVSQTANLQEWQNSSGTVIASITAGGQGQFASLKDNTGSLPISVISTVRGTFTTTGFQVSGSQNIIGDTAASNQLMIRGATSQTGDMLQIQNSSSSVLTRVASDGAIILNSSQGAANIEWTSGRVGAQTGMAIVGDANGSISIRDTYNTFAKFLGRNDGTAGTLGLGDMGSLAQGQVLRVMPNVASDVGILLQGASSQSADLMRWKNSAGTTLGTISKDGYISVGVATGQKTVTVAASNLGTAGTIVTSTSATATAYINQKKLVKLSTGRMVAMVALDSGSTGAAPYYSDDGSTWTNLAPGNAISGWVNGSIASYVDTGGTERLIATYSKNTQNSSSARSYVRVGTFNAGRTTVTWGTETLVGGANANSYPDLVAFAEGTGGVAWIVLSYGSGASDSGAYGYRFDIDSSGAIAANGSAQTLGQHNQSIPTYPSIDYNPTTKDLYTSWSAGTTGSTYGIRFKKASYSGGTWTWGTDREVTNAYYVTSDPTGNQWGSNIRYDGTSNVLIGGNYSGTTRAVWEYSISDPGTAATQLLSASSANYYGFSMAVNKNNRDIYLLGSYYNSGYLQVIYFKYDRATASWSGPTTVDTVGTSSTGIAHSVNALSSSSSIAWVYTAGTGSPFNVKYNSLTVATTGLDTTSKIVVNGNVEASSFTVNGINIAAGLSYWTQGSSGVYSNYAIGIGTTTPARSLHVEVPNASTDAQVRLTRTGTSEVLDIGSRTGIYLTGNAFDIGTTDSNTLRLSTSNTVRLTVSTAGLMRFHAYGAGTLVTDSSGNITASSDERLKDVQGNFNRGLSDLLNIDPILYKWNGLSGMETEGTYAGFSAQNVQLAIPEATSTDGRGYLTLQDRPIIAASVNAIKELNSTNNALEARIAALEGSVGVNPTFASLNVTGHSTLASLTVTGNVTIQGKLTVANAEVTGNLTIGGHLITAGTTPTYAVNAASVNAASVTVEGNDTAGQITFVSATGQIDTDKLLEVIFSQAFAPGKKPRLQLTAGNKAAAASQIYIDTTSTTNTKFELWTPGDLPDGQTYIFNYFVVE